MSSEGREGRADGGGAHGGGIDMTQVWSGLSVTSVKWETIRGTPVHRQGHKLYIMCKKRPVLCQVLGWEVRSCQMLMTSRLQEAENTHPGASQLGFTSQLGPSAAV